MKILSMGLTDNPISFKT